MTWKLVLGALGMLLLACGGPTRDLLTQREASRLLISPDGKEFMRDWVLAYQYDPYQGGTLIAGDSLHPRHLVFFRDGHFLAYDRWNYSDGTWCVQRDEQRLAFTYHIQNGQRVPPEKRDTLFRYQIQRLAGDTLVLGIQGRHGIVRETYCPD